MKLEKTGLLIMLSASILLLAGCRQKSGFDQLAANMANAKAIKSRYVIHSTRSKDIEVSFLFSKPFRFLVSSDDFMIVTNEIGGHYETVHSSKLYDLLPWDGNPYPGTGKLVNSAAISAGPLNGTNPKDFAPDFKWVFKGKKGTEETYSKTVRTLHGPQEFSLVVNDKGMPVRFVGPNIAYECKSFEYLDEQPIEKFPIEPVSGDVSIRVATDEFVLRYGRTFDTAVFQSAPDVRNFHVSGDTLFAIVDPTEPTSVNALGWIAKPNSAYRKVTISKGNATSGFFDPKGTEISKFTSTTPTFVLVGADRKIKGLWLGFDPENVSAFEKDVDAAIKGKDESK